MRLLTISRFTALAGLAFGCAGLDEPQSEIDTEQTTQAAKLAEPPDGEFLQTPLGRRIHKSCIHEVPDGATLDENEDVWVEGRRHKHLAKCAYSARQAPTVNGWVEFSSGIAPSNPYGYNWIRQLGMTFVVPSAPTSNNGQLIYLFPGLEPTSGNSILQPVLQYGTSPAGGGYYWGMANWYVTASGSAVHSPLRRVNTGDTIQSWVYVPTNTTCGTAGTNCRWVVMYYINGVGVGTYWLYVTPPDRYNWAFQGALEAYNVTSCNQLPATSTTFTRDSVYECGSTCATSIAVSPSWSSTVIGGSPSCSYSINTLANGVRLNY